MSLSEWEWQALDSIQEDLAGSDPGLAALLVTFNRLASGEAMPVTETVRLGSRPHARRSCPRLSLQHTVLLLWLVVTLSSIAVAVVLSNAGGQSHCTFSLATVCPAPAPVHSHSSAPGGGG